MLDLSGVRCWSTSTHEHQLPRCHRPRAPTTMLPQLVLQSPGQKNDIGSHLLTQAIALLRGRVFSYGEQRFRRGGRCLHCEMLAGQLGDGRKRALLSCPPLKGTAEIFHTVETVLLLVPVKEPFVHDGVLDRKSRHSLTSGGGGLRPHLLLPQVVWLVSLSSTDA